MPGGDAAVADPDFTLPRDDGEGSSPPLDEAWREILLDIDERTLETDLEKRHSPKPFDHALQVAASHPDSVTISTRPFGREHDMPEHVRDDIDLLLESDHVEHRFVSPIPRTEALLKVFEVGYVYDAVLRFCTEIRFRPKTEGLEEIGFTALPGELSDWMSRVDVLWRIVNGDVPEPDGTTVEELIDDVYEGRGDFIADAREMDMFLPVPPTDADRDDPDELADGIETRLRRNGTVDPDLVHEYCYNRVLEY